MPPQFAKLTYKTTSSFECLENLTKKLTLHFVFQNGMTSLHYGARWGNPVMVHELLAAKSWLDAADQVYMYQGLHGHNNLWNTTYIITA